MPKVLDIDEKDRMILELLEKDPEMSQSEIAKAGWTLTAFSR